MSALYQPTIHGHRGYLNAPAPAGQRWEPTRKAATGSYCTHALVYDDGSPVLFDSAEQATAAAARTKWATSDAQADARRYPARALPAAARLLGQKLRAEYHAEHGEYPEVDESAALSWAAETRERAAFLDEHLAIFDAAFLGRR